MSWLLLLVGCTGEVDTDTDTPAEEPLEWGWADTSSPEQEEPLSIEDLDLLLTEALVHLHTLDPVVVLDAFEALDAAVFEEAASCPVYSGNENFADIDADCTTSAGVQLLEAR